MFRSLMPGARPKSMRLAMAVIAAIGIVGFILMIRT